MKTTERQPTGTSAGYAYIVEQSASGSYWAYFPELPGCTSAGATLAELEANVAEALDVFLTVSRERGDELPPPRSVKVGFVSAA